MSKITVDYDGKWPNACSGVLEIKLDGETIYKKKWCCESSGSAGVDNDNDNEEFCNPGELTWIKEESVDFSQEIQDKVRDKLSEFHVCCGGCI